MPKITDFIPIKPRIFKPDGSRWPDLFGVELELENLDEVKNLPYWTIKEDNSLRNGVEYVLDSPYAGTTLELAIGEFFDAKIRARNSARTSTHIHVNVSDCELDTVRSMILVMYTIEDALFNVVGASRKWSGYACAMSEMEPQRLRRAFRDNHEDVIQSFAPGRNQDRYYGFNYASIGRHGTVEFRYFPGGPSQNELCDWLDLVRDVKKIGLTWTPTQLVERIQNSADLGHFLMRELGPKWGKLLCEQGLESMMIKFNEIAAYATENDTPERRDPLVFINEPLVGFLAKKVLSEAGADYIRKIREQFGTVSFNEWTFHLQQALAMGGAAPVKPKATKKPRLDPVEYDPTPQFSVPDPYYQMTSDSPAQTAGDTVWYSSAPTFNDTLAREQERLMQAQRVAERERAREEMERIRRAVRRTTDSF